MSRVADLWTHLSRFHEEYPSLILSETEPRVQAEAALSYGFNILVDFREKLNPCEEEMCFQRST